MSERLVGPPVNLRGIVRRELARNGRVRPAGGPTPPPAPNGEVHSVHVGRGAAYEAACAAAERLTPEDIWGPGADRV